MATSAGNNEEGWTVVTQHDLECAGTRDVVSDAATFDGYILVDPILASGDDSQNEHWRDFHASETAISILAKRNPGKIKEVKYPIALQERRIAGLPYRGARHLMNCDYAGPEDGGRLDWGDEVQWYLVSHRWHSESISLLSLIILDLSVNQTTFIDCLVEAEMPQGEAEYLNKLLQEEGMRRGLEPREFGWWKSDVA